MIPACQIFRKISTRRTIIVHNPCSGFSSDAIFEFRRALLNLATNAWLKTCRAIGRTDEVLSSVQPEDFDVVVSGSVVYRAMASEVVRRYFGLPSWNGQSSGRNR